MRLREIVEQFVLYMESPAYDDFCSDAGGSDPALEDLAASAKEALEEQGGEE